MRITLAALPLLLLAACGDRASENASGNQAAPEPAANEAAPGNEAATGNAAKPAGAAADPLADARRADMIRECSDDVRGEVPPGTDLDAFCGCAVDGMERGSGERDAMEACAAQMGISPNRR